MGLDITRVKKRNYQYYWKSECDAFEYRKNKRKMAR